MATVVRTTRQSRCWAFPEGEEGEEEEEEGEDEEEPQQKRAPSFDESPPPLLPLLPLPPGWATPPKPDEQGACRNDLMLPKSEGKASALSLFVVGDCEEVLIERAGRMGGEREREREREREKEEKRGAGEVDVHEEK